MNEINGQCPDCHYPAKLAFNMVNVEEEELPLRRLAEIGCSNPECRNYVDPSRLRP